MTSNPNASLAQIDRRLDELLERVGVGVVAARPRIQIHLEGLRQKEALVRRAVEEAYEESRQALGNLGDAVDRVFRLIEIELEVAGAAAAVEFATDPACFADAIAAEVEAWDLYLERLQAGAASMRDGRRADAEAALRGLRRQRNALAKLADDARAEPATWQELREGAAAARADLERAVDGSAVRFG